MASSGFCGARAFPTFLSCSSPCLPSVWTGRHGRKHGPPSWSRGPRTWRHISPSDIPTWAPLHLRLRIHGAGLVWISCRALLLLWHHRQTCLLLLLLHWHHTRQSNKHKKKKITNKTKNKQVRAEIEAAGIKMWIRNICTSAFAGEKTCQFCTQRDDTEDPFLKALGILNQPREWAYQPLSSGKNGGDTCWYCQRAFEAVA